MPKIDFAPEVFNPIYRPYYMDESRYAIYYGGAGSGKSDWVASKFLLRMMNEESHRFLFVRKVARTIRDSQYQLCKEIVDRWGLNSLFEFYDGNLRIVYLPNGNEIVTAGLDDVQKLKSFTGITGIWVEEATELTRPDFDQLDLRMRGLRKNYKQMVLTFNPIDQEHWLREEFFPYEHIQKKRFTLVEQTKYGQVVTRVLRTTWKDNLFLDDVDRSKFARIEKNDDGMHRVYGLGLWGRKLEGLIYPNYLIVDDLPLKRDHVIYGVDYGFSNPTSVVNIIISDGEIYLDEVFYKTQCTTADLIKDIRPNIENPRNFMFADSAEPDRITEMHRAGFNIHPADKGPTVMRRIEFCKRFTPRITARSVNILDEISKYKLREDKNGKIIDEPVPVYNHAMNAYEYGIYSYWKKYGNAVFGIKAERLQPPKATSTPITQARARKPRASDFLKKM